MEGRQALRLARKAANEAGKAGRLLEFRSELLCERELLCRAVRWNDRRAVCELTRRRPWPGPFATLTHCWNAQWALPVD